MLFPRARHSAAAAALIVAVAATADAQSLVYVLDRGLVQSQCSPGNCYGPTVRLINAATGHQLASIETVPFGSVGTSIRASSDGTRLFVTSVPVGNSLFGGGHLVVVDAIGKRVLATVTVGVAPSDVAVLPDNSRAYVVNTAANSVSVVDLSTFTVIATVAVQSRPSKAVVNVDGSGVYVASEGSVSKIATSTNTVAATIAVVFSAADIDISPDGTHIFVLDDSRRMMFVIDAASDSVLREFPTGQQGLLPVNVAAQSATRVFATLQDGGLVFPNSRVQLMDAASGAVLGSSGIHVPRALARDSSGSPVYVVDALGLKVLSSSGTAATTVFESLLLVDAAVVTDACAFEASAAPALFGPAGGSGTLSIPAPPGCSWTVDGSAVSGLSFEQPTSGTGSATLSFRLAATTVPRRALINIGRQSVAIEQTSEQTIPRMNVDLAPGSTRAEPFEVRGWAIDDNGSGDPMAPADPGVDAIHVWAYPVSGVPIFVGTATYGLHRPEIATAFGIKYALSGFRIVVGNLPSGSYTLVFYAHSSRTNIFSNAQPVNVTVQQMPARIVIDAPGSGAAVNTPFALGGWAIDPAGVWLGRPAGVDVVHVWAYPDSGAAPVFVGEASYGGARPDVAAAFGQTYLQSGFSLFPAHLPPGSYTLVVYARSSVTFTFHGQAQRLTINPSNPLMFVDAPAAGTRLAAPFFVAGWAIDLAAGTAVVEPVGGNTTGVDAVHVWAYPISPAGPPMFVGQATRVGRIDLAAVFRPQFVNSGFVLHGTLPPGTYDLVVFARSTVSGTFNNARVVRITVNDPQ